MTKEFNIPNRLNDKLNEKNALSGFVKSSISSFGRWLEQNKLKFFSEYTDHSLKHIENVLITANRLIPPKSWEAITPDDVGTLILAILLHDSAMHLSVDGFINLLESDYIIPGFGDQKWSVLWEAYIEEAKRFSDRKLVALFGDSREYKPLPADATEIDTQAMTGKDFLFTGEFLRRHHHRLAHEISRIGVPGPKEDKLTLLEVEGTKHIADLAGLIARSHGLAIRESFEYLESEYYTFKTFKDIHILFLITLLRLGDILQLQSDRAPRQVRLVRKFRSPVSNDEWEMHQAIRDINWTNIPETIFINAIPENARTYFRIKKQLEQIQYELDSSWAAISESYSGGLPELGLTIRRVRSNLDDLKAFAQKVDFIPRHASFEVADTDMLKLLIKPLYGEKPEVGIRELLQNAIDAVHEAREYMKKNAVQPSSLWLKEQEAEVVISIDEDATGWWVTVSDQGIGMTLDTVCDYYLKAGASLRHNTIWRNNFEREEDNTSRVLRTGKFGVGVLATFLLGNEIRVETRYISDPEKNGITFTTKLDAESIELRKKSLPVGTTIRVRISDKVKDELLGKWDDEDAEWSGQDEWNWYYLRDPKVLLMTNHGSRKLKQRFFLPELNSELPPEWHRINHPDYQDIHWTYSLAPALTSNGIRISKYPKTIWSGDHYEIVSPNVSLFDFNAKLPLNLQRTDLIFSQYPFQECLLEDVIKDFIAFLLVNAPSEMESPDSLIEWCTDYQYQGFDSPNSFLIQDKSFFTPYFLTSKGITFLKDAWHIQQVDTRYALYVPGIRSLCYSEDDAAIKQIMSMPSHAIFFENTCRSSEYNSHKNQKNKALNSLTSIIQQAFRNSPKRYFDRSNLSPFFTSGKRVLMSNHVLEQITKMETLSGQKTISKELMTKVIKEWQSNNWVLMQMGDCPPEEKFDFKKFAKENDANNIDHWPCILAEWYFKNNKQNLEINLSPLAKIWRELIGTSVIPFKTEERRQLNAYNELKPYIEAHTLKNNN